MTDVSDLAAGWKVRCNAELGAPVGGLGCVIMFGGDMIGRQLLCACVRLEAVALVGRKVVGTMVHQLQSRFNSKGAAGS